MKREDQIKPRGGNVVLAEDYEDGYDTGKVKEILRLGGYKPSSVAEVARERVKKGMRAYVFNGSGHARECFVHVSSKEIFLTKKSPVLANYQEAMARYHRGNEFYLSDRQVEEALVDSVKVKGEYGIPFDKIWEDEVGAYLFEDVDSAQAYGALLERIAKKGAGLNDLWIHLEKRRKKEKPFARQLWFGGVCNFNSWLFGGLINGTMFGTRMSAEEKRQAGLDATA